ncbi:MAG: betaine/proline/choline family ABC transporter ATP-binding protein [Ktedonobacteraceae bacterium]|nr:betaine/proline/choline family ABC transporter ATP-binding protein [Ktedonobacteraceae bacterium]
MLGVKFEEVVKTYQSGRPAVHKLSLEVQTGELLVMIGPSGCGKTTTLRMVNRLEQPTSGTIYVNGHDVRSYNPIELRRGIGYTIQQTGLLPHMTVEQNIELVPRLLKWDKKRRQQRTHELLELVNMSYETFAHRYPRQLSGGQQQRIGVLRALAADPPVILMDEPFGALDPISRESLQTELKHLQAKLHKTIIFVTHDIDEAMRLGDRVAILRDGHLLQVATPTELAQAPQDEFVAKFLGRFLSSSQSPVASIQQLIQTGELHVLLELPSGERVVQIGDVPSWFLIDERGVLKGITYQMPEDAQRCEQTLWHEPVAVRETDTPDIALDQLALEDTSSLPVIDTEHRLTGIISHRSAIKALSNTVGRHAL